MTNLTPPIEKLKPGTPELALAKWLEAWQAQNWLVMVEHTQKTWLKEAKNPPEDLMLMFGHNELISAIMGRIERRKPQPPHESFIAAAIHTTLEYKFGQETKTPVVKIMVVQESAPYEPDPEGDWGVNPLSVQWGV